MKNIIVSSLILTAFLLPTGGSIARAQVSSAEVESIIQRITELQVQLLLARIAELQAQIAELMSKQSETQSAVVNLGAKVEAQTPVPVAVPTPVQTVSLGTPICKESNVQIPIVGSFSSGTFSWETYESQNNVPLLNSPKIRVNTGRGGSNQFLTVQKWPDTYQISATVDGTSFTQSVTISCQ
jgi:hypothetical protein